ncbi:MAG: endolytic transglycosylase MltG [bacterium]
MINNFVKLFAFIFIVLFIAAAVVIGSIVWQSYKFWIQDPADNATVSTFVVEEGQGLSTIAGNLESEGLVASEFWFRFYAVLDGSSTGLQAGDFELLPGMNYASIVGVLIDAESEEVLITIPEGYTVSQIGKLVVDNFDVSDDEWATSTGLNSIYNSHEFVLASVKPAGVDLEGYLFPDTYRFFVGATAENIVEELIDTMEFRINEADLAAPSGWTMHEVLTLASIIEREVRSAEDKALVADLFMRRLEIGMALQADSTVNYITGGDSPAISLEDRDINSPYNTYLYPDLPPGPISNPGVDSIAAVVSPTPNDYWYFLTTPEGEVIYSVTHDEHVANKAIYLR